jgi:hypothetical protein
MTSATPALRNRRFCHRSEQPKAAKGLMLLFVTPEALKQIFDHMQYGAHYYLYLAPSPAIGLY